MIEYDIGLTDGGGFNGTIDPNRYPKSTGASGQSWAALTDQKCRNCPLDPTTSPVCPLAIDVSEVARVVKNLPLGTKVEGLDKTDSRWYFKYLPIEDAFKSLFNCIFSTSVYPIFRQIIWKRYFHIPFQSEYESTLLGLSQQFLSDDESGVIPIDLEQAERDIAIRNKVKIGCQSRYCLACQNEEYLESVIEHLQIPLEPEPSYGSLIDEYSSFVHKRVG